CDRAHGSARGDRLWNWRTVRRRGQTTEPNAPSCVRRLCPSPTRLETLPDPPAPPQSAVLPRRPQVDLPPARPHRRRAGAPVPPLRTLRSRRPRNADRPSATPPRDLDDTRDYPDGIRVKAPSMVMHAPL